MPTIRNLLDALDDLSPDSIDRLCELREVGGRTRSSKCEALARSYRGDYADFFEEVLKKDLVELLADPTDFDGTEYYLPSASGYSKPELVKIALKVFRDEKIVPQLEVVDDDEDGEDESEDDDDEDDEDDEDEDEDVERQNAVVERAVREKVEEYLRQRERESSTPDARSGPCPCGSRRPFSVCHGATTPSASQTTAGSTHRAQSGTGSWGGSWDREGSHSAGGSAGGRHAEGPGSHRSPQHPASSEFHPNETLVLHLRKLTWPASLDQIRAARRDLARILHPDRHSVDPGAASTASDTMTSVNDGCDRLERRLGR